MSASRDDRVMKVLIVLLAFPTLLSVGLALWILPLLLLEWVIPATLAWRSTVLEAATYVGWATALLGALSICRWAWPRRAPSREAPL